MTLGAISQRTNIEADLREVKGILLDHADLHDAEHPESRRARRPK
jgi:hypothetical protein